MIYHIFILKIKLDNREDGLLLSREFFNDHIVYMIGALFLIQGGGVDVYWNMGVY